MRKVFLTLITMILFISVFSQENIDPQRPTQSESSSIIGKGYLQSENGFTYSDKNSSYGVFARYGLTDRIELRFFNDLNTSQIYPGLKVYLLEQNNLIPDLSFVLDYDFIFGIKALNYRLAASYTIGENYFATVNAGKDTDWYEIFLIGRSLGKKMSCFIEYYNRDGYVQYNTGITRRLTKDIQVDIVTGLLDNTTFYGGGGFSFRIN